MESVPPCGWVRSLAIENFAKYLAPNNGFAPTRYREVVLTPFWNYFVEAGQRWRSWNVWMSSAGVAENSQM